MTVTIDGGTGTNHPGTQAPADTEHPFGWDEISWFAHQPYSYRGWWLQYAVDWLKQNDPIGHFEMPLMRCLCDPSFPDRPTISYYDASGGLPNQLGFAQEAEIKQIWTAQEEPG